MRPNAQATSKNLVHILGLRVKKKIDCAMARFFRPKRKVLEALLRDEEEVVASPRGVLEQRAEDLPEPAAAPAASPAAGEAVDEAASCILDTRLAPARTRRRCRSSDTLPPFQKAAGNAKGWRTLVEAVQKRDFHVFILYGPSGCGKTRGVYEVSENMLGASVYEVSPAGNAGIRELDTLLRQVGGTKTLMGRRLTLIDDVEGFDPTFSAMLSSFLSSRSPSHAPVVVTCNDIYNRSIVWLRKIRACRVRLFSPDARAMAVAAASLWNVAASSLEHHCREAAGNFYQLQHRLNLYATTPDRRVGLLHTTEELLQGKAALDDWQRSADGRALFQIIHQNAPDQVALSRPESELESLSCVADHISGCAGLPEEYALVVVGMSALRFLSAPRVCRLHMSPPFLPRPQTSEADGFALLRKE